MKKLICISMLSLLLLGCSAHQKEPVGIGSGVNDLKKSPCACQPIQADYSQWQKSS